MAKEKNKPNNALQVKVRRSRSITPAPGGAVPLPETAVPLLKIGPTGVSLPDLKSNRQITGKVDGSLAAGLRFVIQLHEGCITVNNRRVKIPPGMSGTMKGKQFRQLIRISPKDRLFVNRDGETHEIHDSTDVEVVSGSKFTHRRPVPRRPVSYAGTRYTVSGSTAMCSPSRTRLRGV